MRAGPGTVPAVRTLPGIALTYLGRADAYWSQGYERWRTDLVSDCIDKLGDALL